MQEAQAGVQAALEMAGEELDRLIENVRAEGAKVYVAGDYKAFARLDRQREALEAFRQRFIVVLQEWGRLWRGGGAGRKRKSADVERARQGELLPEREYVFPILRALRDAGGSAPVHQVLAAVEREVQGQAESQGLEFAAQWADPLAQPRPVGAQRPGGGGAAGSQQSSRHLGDNGGGTERTGAGRPRSRLGARPESEACAVRPPCRMLSQIAEKC